MLSDENERQVMLRSFFSFQGQIIVTGLQNPLPSLLKHCLFTVK